MGLTDAFQIDITAVPTSVGYGFDAGNEVNECLVFLCLDTLFCCLLLRLKLHDLIKGEVIIDLEY